MYFIGIDAGTTQIKCVVFDELGTNVGGSQRNAELIHPKPNYVEQDPNQIWDSVKGAVREAVVESKILPMEIASIGITGQSGGTLLLDSSRKPLKMISWRDTRATPMVLKWKQDGRENEFYEITGWPLWPEFASVQLAWLKERQPGLLAKTDTVFSCSDWIAYRLSHIVKASASSLIGVVESRTGRLSQRLLDLCGIENMRRCYPEIVDAWEEFGRVDRIGAQETGLQEGTPVVCAGYDIACSAAGAGGTSNGRAVSVLGTSGTNLVVSDQPIRDPAHSAVCAYHIAPALWLTMSESMTAVPNLNWFIDQFCGEEKVAATHGSESVFSLCDELIQHVPPGSDGLVYHPYLTGETGPFADPSAKASFFGISQAHTRIHFLRALYEGVAYSIRHNFEKLESVHAPQSDSLVVVGGGSRSQTWCQMIADITERKVVRPREPECGCVGAAMAGAVATGTFSSFTEAASKFVTLKEEYLPNPERRKAYEKGFKVYVSLIDAYRPLWHELQA